MPFDTAQALEELEPPTLVHEGRTYRGRALSFLEWLKYSGEITRLAENKLPYFHMQKLFRRLCNEWFPPPRRRWLIGPRPQSVADIVASLAMPVQTQVIGNFLHSQARALGFPLTIPVPGSTTPAPASSTSPKAPSSPTPSPGIPATGSASPA